MTVAEETLTRAEAADLFRVQPSTVDRLITSGRLHADGDTITGSSVRAFLTGAYQDGLLAPLEDAFLGHWEQDTMGAVRGDYQPGALKQLAGQLGVDEGGE